MTKKLSDYVKSEQICIANLEDYLLDAVIDGVKELLVTKDELKTIGRAKAYYNANKQGISFYDNSFTVTDLCSDVMGMKLTLIK